jgi:SH3-like domain-containing protein
MTRNAVFPTAVLLLAALGAAGAASAMCVGVSEANLRQGPGTRYEKSWTVYKYMPFESIGKRGRWHRVRDVDGDVHWVNRRLVTQAMRCAVVKVDKANVRSGPGTRYALAPLNAAEKYYAFRVLRRQGSWVKVRDEARNEGWIAKSLLWIR